MKFSDIDQLSKSDFEIFVAQLLTKSGWENVEITKVGSEYRHGDGGVDIFCTKQKKRFAIECKHRKISNKCGVDDLNQLTTGAKLANVKNQILVTNTYFTSEVEYRAFKLGVDLIDRNKLKDLFELNVSEIGKTIIPHPYQQDIINKSVKEYTVNKKKRLLIELATGLGKTYTVGFITKELFKKGNFRVLFLAHQIEILTQSVISFKNIFGIGNYSFSGAVAGYIPDEKTDFVFGVFDTFYSKLKEFSKNEFDIIIVDEAHHVPANTYSAVVKYFDPKLLIGLTATPFRTDNQDVLNFFGGREGHLGKYDLYWALKHRWLAFPRYQVHGHDINQKKIDAIDKGFTVDDIDRSLFIKEKDEKMIEALEIKSQEIEKCKAIVFCRSIRHIKHLIKYFKPGTATFVYSKGMDGDQRRNNIREFREGSYKFILTCNLFNEGIDIPETNLLAFLRTTNSKLIWLQQLGRGLRRTSSKEFVDVFDFVGSVARIQEIQSFQNAYENQKIDKVNLNPFGEKMDNENKINLDHYDTSIKVNWSFKGAAKVLKLLKEQKYDLLVIEDALSKLRTYFEKYETIPIIEDLEKNLDNITHDQINTLFKSYYSYCNSALPFNKDNTEKYFKNKFLNYCKDFYLENGIIPSFPTINENLINKNLPLIDDNFIKFNFGIGVRGKEFDKLKIKLKNEFNRK